MKYSNEFKFVAKSALFANINCPFRRNEWANTQIEQCIAWIAWNYNRIFAIVLIRWAASSSSSACAVHLFRNARVRGRIPRKQKKWRFQRLPLCVTFARVRIRNAIKKCKWPVGLTIGSSAGKKKLLGWPVHCVCGAQWWNGAHFMRPSMHEMICSKFEKGFAWFCCLIMGQLAAARRNIVR